MTSAKEIPRIEADTVKNVPEKASGARRENAEMLQRVFWERQWHHLKSMGGDHQSIT